DGTLPRSSLDRAPAAARVEPRLEKKEVPPLAPEPLPPGWKEYHFPVGKAVVWFPGVPKESKKMFQTKSVEIENHLANLTDAESGLHFTISCWETPTIPVKPLARRLDIARDLALWNIQGKVAHEKELHLGDHRGREVYVEAPKLGGALLRMHIYITGQRVYYLMIFGA